MDHSVFDAYALLVEAGGKRWFYSGDLRAHGRKGGLFDRMLCNPPAQIDAMLMEGSSIGRLAAHQSFPTKKKIEQALVSRIRAATGMVLVAASAQNIDRVVNIYRAAKQNGTNARGGPLRGGNFASDRTDIDPADALARCCTVHPTQAARHGEGGRTLRYAGLFGERWSKAVDSLMKSLEH